LYSLLFLTWLRLGIGDNCIGKEREGEREKGKKSERDSAWEGGEEEVEERSESRKGRDRKWEGESVFVCGREAGREDGREDGREAGREDGREIGIEIGREDGRTGWRERYVAMERRK
jgi:hypothetical protein